MYTGTVIVAQLVWLQRPFQNPMVNNWNVAILKESACDMNLIQGQLSGGGAGNFDVIYTTGFYTYKLAFFWSTNPLNNWDNPNDVKYHYSRY